MKVMSSFRGKFPTLLILAWLIGLTLSHLIFHFANTLKSGALTTAAALLCSILAAILLFTSFAGLGMWLTSSFSIEKKLRVFCAPLLGLILFSTALLIAGLFHIIPGSILLWLILGTLNIVLLRRIRTWIETLNEVWHLLFSGRSSRFVKITRAAVLLLLLLALLIALAPPTQWDSLMYHLSAGKFYINQGGIVTSVDNYRYSNPNLSTVLFMALQILAEPNAAALFIWLLGAWLLIGLAAFFSQLSEAPDTLSVQIWSAAALIYSANGIWLTMTRAYSDALLLPLFLGGFLLLYQWKQKPGPGLLILSGVLCGAMAATRYTAFPFCTGFALLAILPFQSGRKISFKPLLPVIGAAVLIFLPFALKNWLLDGNPVAPYLWGSPAFDAYDQGHTPIVPLGNPLSNLVVLPLQAAVYGFESLDPFQGNVGPFLIGLFPVVFLFWKTSPSLNRKLLAILTALLPAYLTWALGAGITQNLAIVRFYYPMFAFMALLILLRWAVLPDMVSGNRWRKIIQGMVLFSLLTGTLSGFFSLARSEPLPVVIGLKDKDSYLRAKLGHFYSLNIEIRQIAEVEPDTKVLMLWEPRPFYCQPNCSGDDHLNTWQKAIVEEGSAEAATSAWRSAGFTHLLVYHSGAEFLLGETYDRIPLLTDYDALLALIPETLQPLTVFDDYGLYLLAE